MINKLVYNKDMLDEYFLLKAFKTALSSPDPSTQNGAILVSEFGDYISACNTFPNGINITEDRLERELKYKYIEHAERNVLYKALSEGYNIKIYNTMYVCWYACSDCARAIIQSGIKRVVGHQEMLENTPDRWKESVDIALSMLKEAGVITDFINKTLDCEPIRFNGSIFFP